MDYFPIEQDVDDVLEIGMEIILEMDPIGKAEKLKTKIADFDDDQIFIHYPTSTKTNKTVYIRQGLHVVASFTSSDKQAYSFHTKVMDRTISNIPLIVISYPGIEKLIKIQRREFVRIHTSVDVALHFKSKEIYFTTVTDDLSAGGCAVILPKEIFLQTGDIGEIFIVLPLQSGEYNYLKITCEVIRIQEEKNMRYASIKFIQIQKKLQQKIIRYCFEKQLEYRKKELPQ